MSDEQSTTEIAQLLLQVGWSPRELGRRLGVNESTVRAWQTGRRAPNESVVEWLRGVRDRMQAGPKFPEGWEAP